MLNKIRKYFLKPVLFWCVVYPVLWVAYIPVWILCNISVKEFHEGVTDGVFDD